MKRIDRNLSWIAPLVLLGCSSPLANDAESRAAAEYSLRMDPAKASYERDEVATLRLENRSSEDLGYGVCALSVERRAGSTWRHHSPEPGMCIGILYVVASGEHVGFDADFSALEPGVYRYRMELLPGTHLPIIPIRSRTFTILP